jgi:cytochrome c biogenesis protein CcmG/thiol:disulfide interchange protein DsbE
VPAVVAVLAIALLALLIYGVAGTGDDTTLDDAVKAGKRPPAPGATRQLPTLEGESTRTLAQLRGKIVVLNFWASWCEPCRSEAPLLQKAHEKLDEAGTGLVLGATFNDTPSDSRAFEKEFSITYQSVRDVGTELAEDYGTHALPETFVLDRQGRVVAISRGQISQEFLDNALQRAGA